MDGTTLFLGHFGMGRFCTWAVFVWAVFACGPFWDGPFSFGMTWYLGRLHLKAYKCINFRVAFSVVIIKLTSAYQYSCRLVLGLTNE